MRRAGCFDKLWSVPIYARGLAFDAAGRIVALVDGLDATLNQYHGYDLLDRLTSSRLTTAALTTYGYAYDLSGNGRAVP